MADPLGSVRRLLGRVSTLERDTAGLIVANAVNLVLGLGFWLGATRLYPAAQVGRATTLVSVAGSLASFTTLGLGPVIERFAPSAGVRRGALVRSAYAVTAGTSLLAAAVFSALRPSEDLFGSEVDLVLFIALAVVLAVYALQDADFVAGSASRIVVAKNVAVSSTKLLSVVAVAAAGSAAAIASSWLVPAAIAIGIFGRIAARNRPEHERRIRQRPSSLPPRRAIASFWGATLGWLLAGSVPSFVVPLVVVERAGLDAAAYFNATWMMVSASAVLMTMATSPFVAATARPESDLPTLTRQFLRSMIAIGALRSSGLAAAGSVALLLYGGDYAAEALPLLLVMAGVHALSTPAYVYGALARVHRRVWHPMAVQAIASTFIVIAAPRALDRWGLVGIGYTYLAQEVLVLVLASVPLVRLARRSLAPAPQGE